MRGASVPWHKQLCLQSTCQLDDDTQQRRRAGPARAHAAHRANVSRRVLLTFGDVGLVLCRLRCRVARSLSLSSLSVSASESWLNRSVVRRRHAGRVSRPLLVISARQRLGVAREQPRAITHERLQLQSGHVDHMRVIGSSAVQLGRSALLSSCRLCDAR